ncbi:hypothetical protein EXN32_11305 [Agrobacterium tumefaciens]|uniref:Uncharacterized protein n=3 Tax=Rhizobium/Agrobacterium group TaxID=227290 RepID=A0A2Z2PPV2_RHIRH|nr:MULTISPECIES: hypothetical protein [Agrobacterium]ASK42909.1 hypothetical protein [Rhizobium rhizogenes]MCZ7976419.1 hypothetical protein [Agrobacterium salinitolerans]MDA5243307.1 hypothetical protein [Agrobacterium sp. MAFF310724]MDA5247511.1 hypothetical protein [Agrobacterium sp. MAFF210268]TRB03196.1 hypothetical protein EXN61_22920 [Agrobacterium tumefaciens]
MTSIDAPEFNFLPTRFSLESLLAGPVDPSCACEVVTDVDEPVCSGFVPLATPGAAHALLKQIVSALISRVLRGIGALGMAIR